MVPFVSLVIPAHNESSQLPLCLEAAKMATQRADTAVEIIVVINRCTDDTEAIARSNGCVVVHENARNLSTIRNAGAAAARGEIIVTCDADSRMHPKSFAEIIRRIHSGKWVGGGALVLPERWSVGIVASGMAVLPYLAFSGVSFGMFWCLKRDFDEIGGFDERFVSVEDLDFARRLKSHGKKTRRRFGTLCNAPLITSCRKFDQFGDWYLLRNPGFVRKVFSGNDRQAADKFWYDARSK